jgi:hypothetical protein
MLRKTLKIIGWILGSSFLIIGGLFAFLYLRQDQIRDLVFEAINENLETEISVKEAGVSLAKFPKAAIRLDHVLAQGSQNIGDTLFYCNQLYVEFSIWDILKDKIAISSLSLETGLIHLQQKGAVNNWTIFKSSEESNLASVALESIVLKKISFDYRDEDIYVAGYLNSAQAKGLFAGENWLLRANLDAYADEILLNEESYLQFPLPLLAELELNGASGLSLICEKLAIAELSDFEADFTLEPEPNFTINHQKLNLEKLHKLAQELTLPWPEALELEGYTGLNARFIAKANGDLRKEVLLRPEQLNISYESYHIEDVSGQLEYYQQGLYDRLEIKSLQSSDKSLSLLGQIKQLDKPAINLHLTVDKEYQFWQDYLPDGWILQNGAGQLKLHVEGSFNNWEALAGPQWSKAKIVGHLDAQDLALSIENEQIENINGQLVFENQQVLLKELHMLKGSSDLLINGTIENLWAFSTDSLQVLRSNTTIEAEEFRLEDFLSTAESEDSSKTNLDWKERLTLNSIVHLHQFNFKNFEAREVKGSIVIDNDGISGENISMLADEGRYEGGFEISTPATGDYRLGAILAVQNVDVTSAFKSFDNFNQETITADNLEGKLSLKARIEAPLSKELELDINGLMVQSEMSIESGRLRNYAPMQALSRFAEVDELKDVSFTTLKNTITIAEGEIRIPEMAISSNVLNMNLSGRHTFENDIDYVVKLRLGDVLFAKRDKNASNKEFEDYLAVNKRDDDHRIPISISGSVDEPQISIDSGALGTSLKDDLKKQGQELRQLFKKEETKKDSGTGMTFEWDDGF